MTILSQIESTLSSIVNSQGILLITTRNKKSSFYICLKGSNDEEKLASFYKTSEKAYIGISDSCNSYCIEPLQYWCIQNFKGKIKEFDNPIQPVLKQQDDDGLDIDNMQDFQAKMLLSQKMLKRLINSNEIDSYTLVGNYNADISFYSASGNYNNQVTNFESLLLEGQSRLKFSMIDLITDLGNIPADQISRVYGSDIGTQNEDVVRYADRVQLIKSPIASHKYNFNRAEEVMLERKLRLVARSFNHINAQSYLMFVQVNHKWYLSYPFYNNAKEVLCDLYFYLVDVLKELRKNIDTNYDLFTLEEDLEALYSRLKQQYSDSPVLEKNDCSVLRHQRLNHMERIDLSKHADVFSKAVSDLSDALQMAEITDKTNGINTQSHYLLFVPTSDGLAISSDFANTTNEQAKEQMDFIMGLLLMLKSCFAKTEPNLWLKFGKTMNMLNERNISSIKKMLNTRMVE